MWSPAAIFWESLNDETYLSTEVVKTRSEKVAAYLHTLHQQEMDQFNYQFTPATDHFPGVDEAIYAMPPVFFTRDGPHGSLREVSRRGTLLVREGLNVIRLSIDRDLNDPGIQALLAGKIEEIRSN